MSVSSPAARSVRDISHLFLSCVGPPDLAHSPQAAVTTPAVAAASQENRGWLVVDQDRIVRQINPMARQFLNLLQEEPVGQVFELYVAPDTVQHISIQRHNGQAGIGRMTVSVQDVTAAPLLFISIQDITTI